MTAEPEDHPPRRPDSSSSESSGGGNRPPTGWYAMVGIGFEFVVSVVALGAIGWYLDRKWNTTPWLLVVGLVLGLIVGIWTMVRTAFRAFKD
jgi:F0F1-type ATP synthase assembly protein I